MQLEALDPPWKIRSRQCPFFAEGKCFFSNNCNFLHDVQSLPTVIQVHSADDDDDDDGYDLPRPLSDYNSINDSNNGNSGEETSDEEDDSDLDSPTIRNVVHPPVMESKDTGKSETGPSRDSITTVKGNSDSSGVLRATSRTDSATTKFQLRRPQEKSTRSSRSFSTRSRQGSIKQQPPSPLVESPLEALVSTPSSTTSATAQELEVPNLAKWPSEDKFSLADASASSLLTNRLAKSRGDRGPSSSRGVEESASPFSAGALYATYQQDENGSKTLADDMMIANPVSPALKAAEKTPSWLRPFKLTSVSIPQTESRSSTSSHGTTSKLAYNLSASQSLPSFLHTSAMSETLHESPNTQESFDLNRKFSFPSNIIPTNSPHTIVLSDSDGSVSSFSLSRRGSIHIDPSHCPPLPASPASIAHTSISSQASNSLSELTGHSHRRRPDVSRSRMMQPAQAGMDGPPDAEYPERRATTSAEQFKSALERRAQRMTESLRLMSSPNLQDAIRLQSNADSPRLLDDATQATSPLEASQSWSNLPHTGMFHSEFPTASFSDSLLMQQVQSSPPRISPHMQASSHVHPATSPSLHGSSQREYAPLPHPSPRPRLLFAIASDQPSEVDRLLSSGEASVNEATGTDTGLLEFTLANDGLKNKTEIMKILLKYGADPGSLNQMVAHDGNAPTDAGVDRSPALSAKLSEAMNPALKYYLTRPQSLDVDSKPALEALQGSSFAPLAGARFDIIGQDRALYEFYRVLGVHSQRKSRNALVILLCGASGHGKSLLAQKVGSLLDIPTHTINMTALRSQQDIWQCLSTGVDDAFPDLDLSEFLVTNQSKRCVVVLDEIEKVDDPKSLNPLLLPWDIGRCNLEEKKHTDTTKVIWIATSNLGQHLIAEHVAAWGHPDYPPTRGKYVQLSTSIRRNIADVLGASLISRITAVLPFLPFTEVEKIAIGTEAALSHTEILGAQLSSAEIETVVRDAVKDPNFVELEGARSLQRIVEIHLSTRA